MTKKTTIEIIGWNSLVELIGIDFAKGVSKKLTEAALKDPDEAHHAIEWNEKHESVCLFNYHHTIKTTGATHEHEQIYFEYNGTAS